MVVVDVVVVVCVVVGARVVEVVVVVSGGRVDVYELVVVSGKVVVEVEVVVDENVVVEDVVEVVCETALVVNAESGTICQSPSSIFQASITQVPPPFSYIHNSSG
jgi:hypothetical protein